MIFKALYQLKKETSFEYETYVGARKNEAYLNFPNLII